MTAAGHYLSRKPPRYHHRETHHTELVHRSAIAKTSPSTRTQHKALNVTLNGIRQIQLNPSPNIQRNHTSLQESFDDATSEESANDSIDWNGWIARQNVRSVTNDSEQTPLSPVSEESRTDEGMARCSNSCSTCFFDTGGAVFLAMNSA